MKPNLMIILAFCFVNAQSQIDLELLTNSWIKSDIKYVNGEQVPANIKKMFSFMRYEFIDDETLHIASEPLSKGPKVQYSLKADGIQIRFVEYYISKLTSDSLVLIEKSGTGYNDYSVKYSFVREDVFESNLGLNPEYYIDATDTIYLESLKGWARFNKDQSFISFIAEKLKFENYLRQSECVFASFIITKNGTVKDIVVHKGVDKSIDKRLIDAIQTSEKYLEPVILNGVSVNTLRTIYIPFPTSVSYDPEAKTPASFFSLELEEAIVETRKGNIDIANEMLSDILRNDPENIEALFQQTLIFIELGFTDKACENLTRIKKLRSKRYKELYNSYCK